MKLFQSEEKGKANRAYYNSMSERESERVCVCVCVMLKKLNKKVKK